MNSLNVAVLGGGQLCKSWQNKNQNKHLIEIFSHNDFNIASQSECDNVIKAITDKDVVIITAGLYETNDSWQAWLVNCVGPAYICTKLVENKFKGKTILISSHAANWTSWPGIDIQRLVYNNAKHAVSNFLLGLDQGKFSSKFCVIEPAKFESKMSNYQGQSIEMVVNAIDMAIDNDLKSISL